MKAGYAPVWEECKTLAQLEEFQDIQAKYVEWKSLGHMITVWI